MRVADKLDQRASIQDHGMIPDCIQGVSGSTTSGSPIVTIESSDTPLTNYYEGKSIAIHRAGDPVFSDVGHTLCAGNVLLSTIVSVASGGLSFELAHNAVHDTSKTKWGCGTDNTPMHMAAKQRQRTQPVVMHWDKPGAYFFASPGHTNFNGWYYLDRVDFSGCHDVQGEHAKIVMGYPMQFLSINEAVFNKWTGADASQAFANLTAPVLLGADRIQCNPAQMVDGGGNPLFRDGDWILIHTGYLQPNWIGFENPDAQIVRIAFVDVASGLVILDENTLKPFVQENYPSPVGWTGPTGPVPFGIRNVTDVLIHDFTWEGLTIDSFFNTLQFYGGQINNFNIRGMKANLRGGFHAINNRRGGVDENLDVFIDNISSASFPSDYAYTWATGTSNVTLYNPNIRSTGMTYLHLHEGAANCKVEGGRLAVRDDTPQTFAFNATGGAISSGSQSLSITSSSFTSDHVGMTLVVGGTFTCVITAFTDSNNVTVNRDAPSTFSGASVAGGFYIQAAHAAGRLYDCSINGTKINGYKNSAAVHVASDVVGGFSVIDIDTGDRSEATYPYDIEVFGKNCIVDCPKIPADRIYMASDNFEQIMREMDTGQLRSLHATRGVSSPAVSLGKSGNIIPYSRDLTQVPWAAAAGCTVTLSNDVPDSRGGDDQVAKIVTGATGAAMPVSFDVDTPDDETTVIATGPNANGGLTFRFGFMGRAPIDTQMDIAVASFIPATPVRETDNIFFRRIGLTNEWRYYEFVVTFLPGAVGTQINGGFCEARSPIVGLSSTFYIDEATLQQITDDDPAMALTKAAGLAVRYQIGLFVPTGQVKIGDVTDDGSTPVQIEGPVRIEGNLDSTTATFDGFDFSGFRSIAVGAEWDGANWKATDETAFIVQVLLTGGPPATGALFKFLSGVELTIGTTFTPAYLFSFDHAGAVDFTGTVLFEDIITFFNGTASRPLKVGASKELIFEKIGLTTANDIDVAGLTDGGLVKRSGSALASSTDYYTKTEVDALLADLQTQINDKATGGSQTGAASAGTPHTHTQII